MAYPNFVYSDANPVQMWINGIETFNEHQDCTIENECYIFEFALTDVIRLFFKDDAGVSYYLKALDENGEITSFPFTEVASGNYALYFSGSQISALDVKCYLSIQRVTLTNNVVQALPPLATADIMNNVFATDLEGWTGPVTSWSSNNGGSMLTQYYPGTNPASKSITIPSNAASLHIVINGNLPFQGAGEVVKAELQFFNGSSVVKTILLKQSGPNAGSYGDFSSTIDLYKDIDPLVFTSSSSIFITFTRITGTAGHAGYIKDIKVDYNYLNISGLVQTGTGPSWDVSGFKGGSLHLNSASQSTSKEVTKAVTVSTNKTVKIDGSYSASSTTGLSYLEVVAFGPDNIIHVLDTKSFTTSGTYSINGTYNTVGYTNIGVRFQQGTSSGAKEHFISKIEFDFVTGDTSGTEVAKSDYLQFSTTVTKSIGIFYKSFKSYAGINYPVLPTTPYLFIRIPGVFYHEEDVTEQKTIELSNGVIIGSAFTLKVQKEFVIEDAPDYIHKKLMLILSHSVSGSVVINNIEWVMEEGYKKTKRGEVGGVAVYPFKSGLINLTSKNNVIHDVI